MTKAAEHPPKIASSLTPMMAQYARIKAEAGDALLFYRMGDFYELFFSDAEAAAETLSITLTRRGQQNGEDVPMCGVPVHARDGYLAKLVTAGFTVAIAEQVEDPAEARKRGGKVLVERRIVRIVTPGTVTEADLLEERCPSRLAALHIEKGAAHIAAADLSTGEVLTERCPAGGVADLLGPLCVKELVVAEDADSPRSGISATPVSRASFGIERARGLIAAFWGVSEPSGLGLEEGGDLRAMGALLSYIELTQAGQHLPLQRPRIGEAESCLAIDEATRRSLELTEGSRGGAKGSLLQAIDRTRTAGGGRLLRRWLSMPLTDRSGITGRHDAVGYLLGDHRLRAALVETLRGAPDLERALARLRMGRGSPADLGLVRRSLLVSELLFAELEADAQRPVLLAAGPLPQELTALHRELTAALAEDLPARSGDSGFVAAGYDAELDRARGLQRDARTHLAAEEGRLRELTGVKNLRVKHDRTLGYCVEVGKAQAATLAARDDFTQRRTMTAGARFVTDSLTELSERITEAENDAEKREAAIFERLAGLVEAGAPGLSALAEAISTIDVVSSLADLAEDQDYCRPELTEGIEFEVKGGRHPVVEAALRRDSKAFVPNDCLLSSEQEAQLQLVTGPNMAGKSTYLRQNALLTILAQAGSFVAARRFRLGVVDRLFSRVGASDDLASGRSTFMVEMVETAAILNQATARSLVVLDEVGRGTATFDGLSIAWAALEHLHTDIRCRGLFATHYHELTKLAEELPRLHPVAMAVREWRGQVVFLHEVKPGAADRSYGVAVARLAGLPDRVVKRAGQLLKLLEDQSPAGGLVADLPLFGAVPQDKPPQTDEVRTMLEDLEPDEMSPREAHEALCRLKDMLG
jgi:DNA mismatch repair protein MutS